MKAGSDAGFIDCLGKMNPFDLRELIPLLSDFFFLIKLQSVYSAGQFLLHSVVGLTG